MLHRGTRITIPGTFIWDPGFCSYDLCVRCGVRWYATVPGWAPVHFADVDNEIESLCVVRYDRGSRVMSLPCGRLSGTCTSFEDTTTSSLLERLPAVLSSFFSFPHPPLHIGLEDNPPTGCPSKPAGQNQLGHRDTVSGQRVCPPAHATVLEPGVISRPESPFRAFAQFHTSRPFNRFVNLFPEVRELTRRVDVMLSAGFHHHRFLSGLFTNRAMGIYDVKPLWAVQPRWPIATTFL